ncbi:MAG: hypothetical protein HY787_28105 [Deltaproteobacteria bacterium]|nr:hypothetical protein [Deltaproteobacteria bacterium]
MTISEKMYQIAKSLNQLNSNGEVKAFTGNEKGYAKVIDIIRGMSVLVIYSPASMDDKLIISLDFTESVVKKDRITVENTIAKFKKVFNTQEIKEYTLQLVGNKSIRTRNYFDVTNESLENILQFIENIMINFKDDLIKLLIKDSSGKETICYLPTKADIEFAESQLRQSPDEVIGIKAVLDQVELNYMEAEERLKENWRYITERNIELWFVKNK